MPPAASRRLITCIVALDTRRRDQKPLPTDPLVDDTRRAEDPAALRSVASSRYLTVK
jgi:hypothetical protein